MAAPDPRDIVILAPPSISPIAEVGARWLPWTDAAGLAAALAEPFDVAIVISDELEEDGQRQAAVAIVTSGREVIEVRSAGWDGQTFSPLSAACRGVVSGFGLAGIAAAVALSKDK